MNLHKVESRFVHFLFDSMIGKILIVSLKNNRILRRAGCVSSSYCSTFFLQASKLIDSIAKETKLKSSLNSKKKSEVLSKFQLFRSLRILLHM